MKKIISFLLLFGSSTIFFGQSILVSEDFSSGQMPPLGWLIDDQEVQWSVGSSNNAGGIAPEAKFHYTSGNATSRLISPEFDLTGFSSVTFNFSHYLDDYSGNDYSLGVATTSGGSGTWTDVWAINPTGNIGPETLSFEINNGDVGQIDFRFCLYFSGNMYNLNDWYIDDVILLLPIDLDADLLSITTLAFISGPTEVRGIVRNSGNTQINTLDIDWEVDGAVHSTFIDGLSIDFDDTYEFSCDDLFIFPFGTYNLVVTVTNVNGTPDENPNNNSLTKEINVVSHAVIKKPAFEEFTSSTSGTCASFNESFIPWCNTHENEMTLVKYQMDWPNNGDPYYTEEGGVRKEYYGILWVPWLIGDGTFCNTNTNAAQVVLEAAASTSGQISLVGSHSLNGTEMTITTTILPYANLNNSKIYIIVFENLTTGNVGNNGEASFDHVMMKMIPDANGTSTDLVDRIPFTITETVELNGTNVEEWDDLGVAIIVQDNSSKFVFQSDYSIENMVYATEGRLSNIYLDGSALAGFDPDVMDYDVVLPLGTVEMPVITAELMDANGIKVIVPANEFPGTTTIDSYGEDLATHYTYNINLSVLTDIGNEAFEAVQVYPNPTNGKLFLRGTENTDIKIYSIIGTEVATFENFTGNTIDLSEFDNGIYFINIILEDKTIVNKKINLFR